LCKTMGKRIKQGPGPFLALSGCLPAVEERPLLRQDELGCAPRGATVTEIRELSANISVVETIRRSRTMSQNWAEYV
jgi:hypothetical protein